MRHITLDTSIEMSSFNWPNPPYLKVTHQNDETILASCIFDLLDKNTLMGLYYEQELNIKEIGAIMGVSE